MKTKSSPQERLSGLRDKLSKIEIPPCPTDPYTHIKDWIAEATPIMRVDWPKVFDDFDSLVTIGSWTNIGFAIYGGSAPDSHAYQQAWAEDAKEASEFCRKVLRFLDGLLTLPSNRQEKKSSPTDQSVHIHIGDKASVGNLVVSRSIINSFNKIESSKISDELKQTLQDLTIAVNAMATQMPDDVAAQVAHDLETLTTEATSKAPRPQWCQLSVEGLKKAAKDIGEIGLPVIKLAGTVLTLLLMKP